MGRRSAAKDATFWHETVLDWCEREWGAPRARSERQQAKQQARSILRRKSGLTSRFLFELDTFIALANGGSTNHAEAITRYFYFASMSGKSVDGRVLQFLEEARQRYAADPKRRTQNALLLARERRGNPGGARGRHKLTPDGRVEAAELVLEKMRGRTREKRAIKDVAEEWNVSERTVRAAVAELKKESTEVNSGNC